ncbi:unnamed protein product [Prorocentrum cordatum]|uniref:RanBP2-type domain-containing protein n=1 Tax=Prorocentrum cordatum TaxID=2364126 RepID=A0ABN9S8B3_9DINO|nr:unnamed protein product [Polarella glacialis]
MAPPKLQSGHTKQRVAWSQQWHCRFCWAPSGARWWNHAELVSCKQCQRSKGQCFHSNRVPNVPSVSSKEKTAAAELRKLQSELKQAQSEVVKLKAAGRVAAPAPDPFGMAVDSGAALVQLEAEVESDRAKELRDLLDQTEGVSDSSGGLQEMRRKYAEELEQLRVKRMGSRPLPVQMQQPSQQIKGLERKAEAKRAGVAKLLGQVRELQSQHDEAATELGTIQSEIAVLEAQRAEVALQFPQPATVIEGVKASLDSVLPSVQMSAEQMVQVLGTFGADEEAAKDLHRAVGRVRAAAVKANAERQAELERRQAEAARGSAPPTGGAAPGTPIPEPGGVQRPAGSRAFRLPTAAGVGADTPEVLQAFLQAMGQAVPAEEADLREAAKRFADGLESFAKRQRLEAPEAAAVA